MLPIGPETKEKAESKQTMTPHHFHKYNLDCGCWRCKIGKKEEKYKRRRFKNDFYFRKQNDIIKQHEYEKEHIIN